MKNVIWGLIIIVIIASCSRNNDRQAVVPNIEIGSKFDGGYVFYILKSSDKGYIEGEKHGFVVYPYDLKGKYVWGCDYINPIAFDKTLGGGEYNTALIKDDCVNTVNGPSTCPKGWWIPNLKELSLLYLNSYILDNLTKEYWTSENRDLPTAPAVDFKYSTIIFHAVEDSLYVRPIKSF